MKFAAVLLALATAACSNPTPPPSTHPRPVQTIAPFPSHIFPGHRVVAYYGAAHVPDMGILGHGPPSAVLPKLLRQARAYQNFGKPVMPAFELIVVVAQRAAGPSANYSAPVDASAAQPYLQAIRSAHGLLILDIQPGRAKFLPYVKRYERLLREPDVSLALDSEWSMAPTEVPGDVIGGTSASAVNEVSEYLSQIVARYHLPQKLLIVHQFTSDMIAARNDVQMRPNLAIVFHVDGFGSRAGKISKYRLLSSARHGAFIGIKLFYEQDVNLFAASEVMRLSPQPDLITYQ